MLGPLQLTEEEVLVSDADGTTGRSYYWEIPFASLGHRFFVEYDFASLTSAGTIDMDLEHSVSGRTWKSALSTAWSQLTQSGDGVLKSDDDVANRARLKVTIGGSSGSAQKSTTASLWVSAKPF